MKEVELERLYREAQERAHPGRLERLQVMNAAEDADPAWVSHLASEYYEEARLCWIYGAFVATIVMSQLTLEELLRGYYRAAKGVGGILDNGKEVDSVGFKDLTEQARQDEIITPDEYVAFQRLRKDIRNPYVHPRDVSPRKSKGDGIIRPDFVMQGIKISAPTLGIGDVKEEASEAITLLVSSFRKISSRLFP